MYRNPKPTEDKKKEILMQLRNDILKLEGFKPKNGDKTQDFGLGILEEAFPYGIFPTAAIHEFLCEEQEEIATCNGFLSSLLQHLLQQGKYAVWISPAPQVFPAALKNFGINPEQIIFVHLHKEKDILWAMEEALKCKGLAAVIAELRSLSFADSRRLQLCAESSRITGFVLRKEEKKINPTACIARWHIQALPSFLEKGIPGVGFPQWQVELLKVKNGQAGKWKVLATPTGLHVSSLSTLESSQTFVAPLKTGS